ncbi:YkyA family protein [Virgibacillus ainsalahensis]
MLWRKGLFFLMIGFFLILAACNSESAEMQIHNHLEEAVELEEGFEQQQSEITELERQEQELYSQIADLGMDEFEQIQEISQQAIEVIDQRADKIELEKESIEASKEEFNKTEGLIEDLEDEEIKAKAENMYEIMNNRYGSYNDLYAAYTSSLELEKELYTMLQEEGLEQETLTDHIKIINDSYQQILDANEQFNNETVEYNALKQEFYDAAEINVEYEENSTSDTESEDA